MSQGRIVLAHSGSYRVAVEGEVSLKVPRGRLRRLAGGILAGDLVEVEADSIVDVLPRKNRLSRPPVANVDWALLLVTVRQPAVSMRDVDRRLAMIHLADVPVALVLHKADLAEADERETFLGPYRQAGYDVLMVSCRTGMGIDTLRERIPTGVTVLSGPSGVGKSSLLSALSGREIAVGALGGNRGRHTTKWVELIPVGKGYVADTPGFSALEFPPMARRDFQRLYPEIARLAAACRFGDCLHLTEPNCAVRQAVDEGAVHPGRYGSYKEFLEEVEERW